MGSVLARKLGDTGHIILLANSRGPETLKELVDGAAIHAVAVAEAVRDVDIVIIAVPVRNVPFLATGLFDKVPPDVTVVDTCNYYPGAPDEAIADIEDRMPESQWVSQQLGRPVVKAFNTILAHSLATKGTSPGAAERVALPVSGDQPRAKKFVIDLIDTIGFDAIDAGTLAESWRQQPGTPACCSDLQADSLRSALSMANKVRAPRLLALTLEKISQLQENFSNDDLIAINRAVHGL
jgi:predicted dinucleotide-binding enzyme